MTERPSTEPDPRHTARVAAWRARVAHDYVPRHPELATLDASMLAPSFVDAVTDGRPEALRGALTELGAELYTLEVFTSEWCAALLEEVDHFERWAAAEGLDVPRPNSMNRHGAIVDDFGLQPALRRLVVEGLRPFAALLYPEVGGASLDDHHAFVVDYAPGKDTSLDFHVDDAEVTLNLCLGETFEGGALYFRGRRCWRHVQTECSADDEVDVAHRPGVAVLHAGKHRHGSRVLRRGRRRNLIVWCRSPVYRAWERDQSRDACPAWCRRSRAR